MKKAWSIPQVLLFVSICITIAAVIANVIITNKTLRSVEKNLPNTLIAELVSLDRALGHLSDVQAAAKIFSMDPSEINHETLLQAVQTATKSIYTLRQSYVFDNLVQASAFHAVAAPAIADLQIWTTEGISGFGPKSDETSRIVLLRISTAYEKARALNRKSRINAQNKFSDERQRLDRFLSSVNLLFILTLLITIIMVFLFIRQHFSKIREMKAEQTLKTQRDLLNSLFENIRIGIMVWGRNSTLIFTNRYFTELTGYTPEAINNIDDWLDKTIPDKNTGPGIKEAWTEASLCSDEVIEHPIVCRTGQTKVVEFRKTILSDKRSLVTLTDITERKQRDEHLHHFKTAVELSSDAIGMSDPDGRHWYQNKAFDELFGNIGQDPPASLYVDQQLGRQVFEVIMAGGQWIGEVEMYARDKSILSILLRAYAIRGSDGRIIGLVGTHTDMSLQKKAEKALLRSEEKYRAVVENTPDLLYRTNMDGVITFISSSVESLSGYTVDEALGMKMAQEVYAFPEERDTFLEKLKAEGSVKNFEARLRHKDGSIWWASTNAHFFTDPEGNIRGVEGITRDITDTKLAEAALKESEERFKVAGKASYDLIYEWDVKTDALEWFGDVDKLLGFKKGDISSNIAAWLDLIHPDDLPMLAGAVELHRTSTEPINYEYRIRRKDGTLRYWTDNALPLLDENNRPFRWIGVCADITQRKQNEQALLKNEQQMRAILDASPDPMVMYDTKGLPQFINPAFTKVFGWTLEELKGKHIPFIPDDQKKLTLQKIKKIYETGRPLNFETRRYTKDHKTLDIFLSAAVIKSKDEIPTGMVVNLTDITQKKALEAQSEHAQKMESIGTLAGGIAHDFNNLLSGVFGYLDLARKKTTDPQISQYLEKAFNASDRAKGLTHQLLTFSKGGAPIKKVESLVPFLEQTCQFALSGANVSCTFDIQDDLWMSNYDKNQIGQVIDNIVINAQHAMPSGGNIHVSAVNAASPPKGHPGLSQDKYVKISISDPGTGIQDKYLKRIFDPFFTTKQKGSGLGLATSYSIVKRHNGIIDVESKLGTGSSFHIYLPAAEPVGRPEEHIEKSDYTGSGKILVMDDEEMIREMLADMLEPMGFSVVCTGDGESAVQAFDEAKKDKDPFYAVILDLTVPGGMGGKDTVAQIRKRDNRIPVFVASGYSKEDTIANPEKFGFTASLQKPFTIGNLIRVFETHLK